MSARAGGVQANVKKTHACGRVFNTRGRQLPLWYPVAVPGLSIQRVSSRRKKKYFFLIDPKLVGDGSTITPHARWKTGILFALVCVG